MLWLPSRSAGWIFELVPSASPQLPLFSCIAFSITILYHVSCRIASGKLAVAGRRVTQAAMEKLGAAHATDDSEYESCKAALGVLKAQYSLLAENLRGFLAAVQSERPNCFSL